MPATRIHSETRADRFAATSLSHAYASIAGPSTKLPCTFAHSSDDHGRQQVQPRRPGPHRDQPQQDGEQGDPEQLRPERERRCRQGERRQGEDGRGPRARPALPRRRNEDARREGDQPRTQHRQELPPADGVAGSELHLCQPLLVHPRRAPHRERPGVSDRQRPRGQDLVARAHLVGEVHGWQRDQQRHERREGDRDPDPEPVEGEPHRRDARQSGRCGPGHSGRALPAVIARVARRCQ